MKIPYTQLLIGGHPPQKHSAGAAGYDLTAAESAVIPPLGRKLIRTGISIAIPDGYYGRIAPRSGLANKFGIDVFGGVIDSDYRGDIGVILFNSELIEAFSVQPGDRIAQLIIEPCCVSVEWIVSELAATERGMAGFGSTGIGI